MDRFVSTMAAAILACSVWGCEEEAAGEGTLAVEIWGEEYMEQGIPESVFVDGWSVTFVRFLVAVGEIGAARGGEAPDLVDDTQRVYDLTETGPHPVLTRLVAAGDYDETAYRIWPAAGSAVAGNATAADLELMKTGGYSVYTEGTATDGTVSIDFAWGFDTDTLYHGCQSEAQVTDGGSDTVQITVHADHLFYDDLFSEEPDVTFETLATADADTNGELTQAELAAFDIMTLPNYGVGSTGVDNLWDFISYLTHTLGHIDGEGHCETTID